jgi:hypothetical protein
MRDSFLKRRGEIKTQDSDLPLCSPGREEAGFVPGVNIFRINILKLWVLLYDGVFDKETAEYRWDICINS